MRYERKYRIEGIFSSLIEQGLRLHPAGLKSIYPNRQVNNIYFDTFGLTTYKNNVVGESKRQKFRVRWYGSQIRYVEHPHLEIKIRENELGDKKHFKINSFHVARLNQLTKQVNQLCPQAGGMLRPVLLNSYQRQYFGTNDKKFRITLDTQLEYTPLLNSTFLLKHQFKEFNVHILELKYDEEYELIVDPITQYLPYRRTKNSKYVTGIELCYW